MGKLEFRLTNDTLFKMLFVKHPALLKGLIALMLGIPVTSITDFEITNTEMLPEAVGDKFCRLDIHMRVNGKHVDLEVQVENENDYPERSLYYWARDYSTALQEGGTYLELPDVIIISILDFRLFDCETHYSRFQVFEETRHELLATKLDLRYYELVKLSKAS